MIAVDFHLIRAGATASSPSQPSSAERAHNRAQSRPRRRTMNACDNVHIRTMHKGLVGSGQSSNETKGNRRDTTSVPTGSSFITHCAGAVYSLAVRPPSVHPSARVLDVIISYSVYFVLFPLPLPLPLSCCEHECVNQLFGIV